MNGMIRFDLQNRDTGIFSGKHALFLPFNPHFCVMNPPNMQKRSTQILYQYLGTKVAVAGELLPRPPSLSKSFLTSKSPHLLRTSIFRKLRRAREGRSPFELPIVHSGVYGGHGRFLRRKIPFSRAKIVSLQFLRPKI